MFTLSSVQLLFPISYRRRWHRHRRRVPRSIPFGETVFRRDQGEEPRLCRSDQHRPGHEGQKLETCQKEPSLFGAVHKVN